MNEKLKDRGILPVKEKAEDELKVVKGINPENGKLGTASFGFKFTDEDKRNLLPGDVTRINRNVQKTGYKRFRKQDWQIV
jgi:hypothetical protein